MKTWARSEKARKDKPVLKTVLIYEDFAAGVRARRFCERLMRASNCTLEEQLWNFDGLTIRKVRNAAAMPMQKADVVIVSLSGHRELPAPILAWFYMWLWLLGSRKPALVALFDPSARNIASTCSSLGQLAKRGGIDFFATRLFDPA